MGSHGPILGDYPLTRRVIDLLMAMVMVVITMAIVSEIVEPSGTARFFSLPNDGAVFLAAWGGMVFLSVAAVMALARFRRQCRRLTVVSDNLTMDEAQLLQEIHGRLERMEERIEALETLVVGDRVSTQARRP